LDFFDKYEFKPEKCDRVINFINKLKHYLGAYNGKPFKLLPYQEWIIYSIFGFYNGEKRVTNYVYFEVARKNGKTALMAAICLYMLVADGENGAEVELVANSAKQAKIAFTMASNFLRSVDPKNKYFKRYRDSIKFDSKDALLQVLAADASGNDGYNAYCFVLDEAHEQKDGRLWDVMVSSQGMRQNPLGIISTTAGFNKFGFCYGYRETCLNILNGSCEDDTQFAAIYTLDEGDDWTDEKNWIKANPSLGATVQVAFLQTQVTKAKNSPSSEVGIKTKNFNVWCDT
jgi:phage terminase large subunit-like protein